MRFPSAITPRVVFQKQYYCECGTIFIFNESGIIERLGAELGALCTTHRYCKAARQLKESSSSIESHRPIFSRRTNNDSLFRQCKAGKKSHYDTSAPLPVFCHSKTRIPLTNPQKRRAGLVCSVILLLLKSSSVRENTDLPESSSLSFLQHTQSRRPKMGSRFAFFFSPFPPLPPPSLPPSPISATHAAGTNRTRHAAREDGAAPSGAPRPVLPSAPRNPTPPAGPAPPPAAPAAPSPAHPMLIAAARSPHASRVTPPARPSQGGTDSAAGGAGSHRGLRGVCRVIGAAEGY